ncbi:MAG: hypothetical protein PHC53_03915, partial [Patescibacteria group bacterium]|nr:hypothetical protein [Patescibacteria group bacterium]
TINVTVNGKKPAAHPPVSLGRFGTWCQGKSGTRLLVAAFILLVICIGMYEYHRWRKRRKAGRAPPSTGWGAGPDEPTEVGKPRN